MGMRRHVAIIGGATTGAIGVIGTAWAWAGDDLNALAVSVTTWVFGTIVCVTGIVCRAIRTADVDAAFELGRQVGHDRGYWEGRRTARPVVVPLHPKGGVIDVRAEVTEQEVAGNRSTARR